MLSLCLQSEKVKKGVSMATPLINVIDEGHRGGNFQICTSVASKRHLR
jgi:hypothetical protein